MPPESAIVDRILADLRAELVTPTLAYGDPPERLTGGFDTELYAFRLQGAGQQLTGRLVIRIFGPRDGRRAAREAAAQAAVAAEGYPVPPVLLYASGQQALGRPYILMPFIEGTTLLAAGIPRMPGRLARAHLALHAIDPAPVRKAMVESAGDEGTSGLNAWLADLHGRIEQPGMERFATALAWFETNRPPEAGQVICHLDFHPLNILARDGRVVAVIDWGNLDFGDPAADVATTRIILEMGPVRFPRGLGWAFQLVRRWVAWRYLRDYRRGRPIGRDALRYYEALRCFQSISNLSLRRLAERRGDPANASGYAWSDPATLRRIKARLSHVLGFRVVAVD